MNKNKWFVTGILVGDGVVELVDQRVAREERQWALATMVEVVEWELPTLAWVLHDHVDALVGQLLLD